MKIDNEYLRRKVDEAVFASLEQSKEDAAETIKAMIDELMIYDTSSSEIAYMLGYCWYNYPSDSIERSKETQKWLNQALKLDNNNHLHHYARLYLGHFYFDTKSYAEALKEFSQIPPGKFESYNQKWRELKLLELILCCEIYLAKDVTDKIVLFKKSYLQAEEAEKAIPSELINCVVACITTYSNISLSNELKSSLIEIIEDGDLSELFAEELACIKGGCNV